MSEKLLQLARAFVSNSIEPAVFAEEFIAKWKQERDSGLSFSDPPVLSEALSSIFCMSDMFNADSDREDYEFDEYRLRREVDRVIRSMNS
jgi:hypothetical protein